jgi:hypothetical protein
MKCSLPGEQEKRKILAPEREHYLNSFDRKECFMYFRLMKTILVRQITMPFQIDYDQFFSKSLRISSNLSSAP